MCPLHRHTFERFHDWNIAVSNKTKVEELEKAPSVDDERARLKKKLLDISKKRVKLAREYTVSVAFFLPTCM